MRPTERPPVRRWAEGVVFVAIWVGMGLSIRMDADAYLLLGIPLTLLFQLAIRRAPVRALWVRDAPPFRLGWTGLLVAVGLAILPLLALSHSLAEHEWVQSGWMLCAGVGAIAAGYGLHHFSRATIRPFLLCLATAGLVGVAIFVISSMAAGGRLRPNPLTGLGSLLLYFPVMFVLEEVSFRGALDSHFHLPGDNLQWLSALAVSALWGLWHFPTVPPEQRGLGVAVSLIGVHTLVGVPLSLYWRRSGNLAVPGFTHAIIDAVRNALQAPS